MHLFAVLLLQAHAHGDDAVFVASPKSLADHHLAGIMVIALGILAYLEHSSAARFRPVRYLWPLPLLAVACYLFLFSDTAEPWGLWFFHGDWSHTELEHKFMEGAAILIATIELSLRTGWLKARGWKHIITTLMFAAGLLLLLHHGNHEHAVHVQHNWMGAEVIALACAKLASDLQARPGLLARYIVPLLYVVVGLQLVFYFE